MPYMSLWSKEQCIDKDEEIDMQLEYMRDEYTDNDVCEDE